MIFLLDSNIIIDVLRSRSNRSSQLKQLLLTTGGKPACTSVVITDVYMGLYPTAYAKTDRLFSSMIYIPVTPSSARLAGTIYADWRCRGHTLSTPDAMIAAVCIESDCTLVTDNIKHFPMAELKMHLLP